MVDRQLGFLCSRRPLHRDLNLQLPQVSVLVVGRLHGVHCHRKIQPEWPAQNSRKLPCPSRSGGWQGLTLHQIHDRFRPEQCPTRPPHNHEHQPHMQHDGTGQTKPFLSPYVYQRLSPPPPRRPLELCPQGGGTEMSWRHPLRPSHSQPPDLLENDDPKRGCRHQGQPEKPAAVKEIIQGKNPHQHRLHLPAFAQPCQTLHRCGSGLWEARPKPGRNRNGHDLPHNHQRGTE